MKLLPLITFQEAADKLVINVGEVRKAQNIDILHSLWDHLDIIACDDLHNTIGLLGDGQLLGVEI